MWYVEGTHLLQFAADVSAPSCSADRVRVIENPPMHTVISRGLRPVRGSPTRSAPALKNARVYLRSTVQRTRCSRVYSSTPSSGDRDKTAVGVSPHFARGGPGFVIMCFRCSLRLPLRFSSPPVQDCSITSTPRRKH